MSPCHPSHPKFTSGEETVPHCQGCHLKVTLGTGQQTTLSNGNDIGTHSLARLFNLGVLNWKTIQARCCTKPLESNTIGGGPGDKEPNSNIGKLHGKFTFDLTFLFGIQLPDITVLNLY